MNIKCFWLRSRASVLAPVFLAIISYNSNAHAYVDPGIVGVMFQYVYALIFGAVFIVFVRPIKYIKQLLQKFRKTPKSSALESPEDK